MILSNEEIKVDDWGTYTVFKQSHLEANDRIKELEAKLRELKEIVGAYYNDCLGPVLEELVETIEWRDETNELYSEMYADWVKGKPGVNHIDSIFEISEEVEVAFEKALSNAKTHFKGERK